MALAALSIALIAPAGASAATVSEFPVPTPSSQPAGMTAGPDGAVWFTEENGNKIGRITTGGAVTEYPIPSTYSAPQEMTAGPDGALWFTEFSASKIGRITTDGSFTEYSLPAGSAPDGITVGPDGALWFTENGANKIGRITTGGIITEYPLATGFRPGDITPGPDGRLWFTESEAHKIGAITTAGSITEYDLPAGTDPSGIAAYDGALWFAEFGANKIGRISTTGIVTNEFPTGSGPDGITVGTDGALWFTETIANKIGRLTTGGSLTEFPVPTPSSDPNEIVSGPDGALWFTEFAGNKIGRITPDPVPPILTATDPASPANNNSPKVKGTVGPEAAIVKVYKNASCSEPAVTGTAAAFTGAGIAVPVTDDTPTDLSARARDATGALSDCSNAITYLEDSSAPGSAASSPALSNSTSITVNYSALDGSGSGIKEVELWVQQPGDPGYSLAATDTSPASPSFTYTASRDGPHHFYSRARDNAGNYEGAPASPPHSTTVVETVNQTLSWDVTPNEAGRTRAAFNITFSLSRSDGGRASPPTRAVLYIQDGFKFNFDRFPACDPEALRSSGPSACPPGSRIGAGSADFNASPVIDSFQGSVTAFNGANSTYLLYVVPEISSPVVFEGTFEYSPSGPYGYLLDIQIPLIPTLPGQPNATLTSLTLETGATIGNVSYIENPASCDGSWQFAADFTYENGNQSFPTAEEPCTDDMTPPETTIDSGPTGRTSDPTPTFTFSSSEGSSFECRVDGGAFVPCASPHTTYSLTDGLHAFEVRATDAAGNTDPAPASRWFIVDTAVPQTIPPVGPPTVGPTVDTGGPRVAISTRSTKVDEKGRVPLRLECPVSERDGCTGTLTLETSGQGKASTSAKGPRNSRIKLGKSGFRIVGGGTTVVRVRLSKASQLLVRKLKQVRVRAIIEARGKTGYSRTTKRVFTLNAKGGSGRRPRRP